MAAALLALVAGVGLALATGGGSGAEAASPPARALPVELVTLRLAEGYAVREEHAGRVVSRRTSELGFERAGRLVEVTADQGDRVEAGGVLARLDTRALRARRRELVARRERILAELALARETSARREELHATGVVSTQRLDESVYARAGLESQRAAAEAALEHLDVEIELSVLRAPFDGILVARYADEGTVLQPTAPVLRLIEADALEVHVGLPPAAAARLEPGSRHEIDVEGTPSAGTLRVLLPTIDPDTRTLTAVFDLEAADANVRHGALARIAIETRVPSRGFWLPLAALTEGRRGLWTAYVAVPSDAVAVPSDAVAVPGEGVAVPEDAVPAPDEAATGPDDAALVAERRPVEIVHATADRAFVRGALFDGDRVVASGVHRVVPGVRVRATEGA